MAEPESWARHMSEIAGIEGGTSGSLEDRVCVLYESSRQEIYRYLMAMKLDVGTAQEITQEAFLRLHASLRDGHTIRNERAWLFTVAHNLANHARSRQAAATGLDPESHVSREPAADAELVAGERIRRLRQAVESLSAQQRQCLELRAEGFRYREIGEILGIGTSTVGEFLRRGMQRLRKAVEG